MSAFQILNNKGISIPINILDKKVCEIVGNKIDPKYYCILGKRENYPHGLKGEFEYHTST